MTLLLWTALSGCNDAGYAVVSIDPIYGWTDGCTALTISGHGFGDDVSATVGGKPVADVELPTKAIDKGFTFSGTVPAGSHGLADVVVTSGGVESKLEGTAGYYYVECPGAGTVDTLGPTAVASGTDVTIVGCGLDATALLVRLTDAVGTPAAADVGLTTVCGTAKVSFAAPELPDGTYTVSLVNSAGEVVSGGPCPPPDSADTAYSCTTHTLTYAAEAP